MIWLLLFLGAYPYIVYPVVVWVIARLTNHPVDKDDTVRSVTVVIAAHNEARHIAATVQNKLQQNYPPAKLNVFVVSDGSDDGTDDIVQNICDSNERVKLIRQDLRQGKTAALNLALGCIDTEIIVFSDANSIYDSNAVKSLVRNFADPNVGYVTGKMIYVASDGSTIGDGCSAYMRYENRIRSLESKIGSIVGVDGGIDAVRSGLYVPMRDDQLPDFVLPLAIVKQGFRVVYEPEAVLFEEPLTSQSDEFRMRVRVATRAIWALLDHLELLNPFKHGWFSFQILSHKWMRYASFIPLGLVAILTPLLASKSTFHGILLWAEVAFVISALASVSASRLLVFPGYCQYFLILNLSSLVAAYKVLKGQRYVTWKPRSG